MGNIKFNLLLVIIGNYSAVVQPDSSIKCIDIMHELEEPITHYSEVPITHYSEVHIIPIIMNYPLPIILKCSLLQAVSECQ